MQGFSIVIAVIRNKCAAVLIGASGMGLADILGRTSEFIAAATGLGIPFSGVRKLSEECGAGDWRKAGETVRAIRAWCAATGVAGMLACAALSPFIAGRVFKDASLAPAFLAVSPVAALMAVYGGEAAVLKGFRRLRKLAAVSAAGSALTLAATVAAYLAFGVRGVPLALLAGAAVLAAAVLRATRKDFPWTAGTLSWRRLREGRALLLLGAAYAAAGIAGSGAEIIVRALINAAGSREDVGLYASGFILCVSYTRIIFIAMDADYFPRLAALGGDSAARNAAVCRQIDVCVLLMGPMLAAFLTFLPAIVRLLYTADFAPAAGMCVAAGGFLFIKAVVTPVGYLPLARNDAGTYLLTELAYDTVFVCLLTAGYRLRGLQGAGLALTASNLAYLAFVLILYRRLYGFRMEAGTLRVILAQGGMLLPVILMFSGGHSAWKCAAGCAVSVLSAAYSVRKLRVSPSLLASCVKRRRGK